MFHDVLVHVPNYEVWLPLTLELMFILTSESKGLLRSGTLIHH